MKRYIVTEERLDRLERDAMVLGKYDSDDYSMSKSIFDRSAKQARAIEIPEWATHFYCEHNDAGGYVPYIQEIPK